MNVSNRNLAAIVFTDIVGFTKLTAENKTEKEIMGDSYKEDLFSKSIVYPTCKKKEIDYVETEIISLLEEESMKGMSATEF